MQKWSFFAMGAMTGVIAILSCALLMQQQGGQAYAAAMQGDDTQNKLVISSGMSQQNQSDMLWIVHKHPRLIKPKEQDKELQKDCVSLSLYKITRNGEGMKLIAVRDISYDEELVEYQTARETPSVKDVYDLLKKQMPKSGDK